MPFEWKAFVDLAGALQQQAGGSRNTEALLRTAISRAYFGAFCHARNYARDFLGFDPRNTPDDHGGLRAHLKGKRRVGDAERLDRLRQWRNKGDYLDELAIDLNATALAALRDAER